jgi:ABC-type phosphate transport system substrate-binding protein
MGVDLLMKLILSPLLALTLLFAPGVFAAFASERIVIVTHSDNAGVRLSREQIRNLFMGASIGRDLQPVALPPGSRTRSLFNIKIVGLSDSRVQSYWAQMKFTGRRPPPQIVSSEKAMIQHLQDQTDSIGYLTADAEIPDDLIIIYTTD